MATPAKAKPAARKVGRPSKYKPEYVELAKKLCMLGQAAIGVALGDLQCAGLWRSRASLAGPMTAL